MLTKVLLFKVYLNLLHAVHHRAEKTSTQKVFVSNWDLYHANSVANSRQNHSIERRDVVVSKQHEQGNTPEMLHLQMI